MAPTPHRTRVRPSPSKSKSPRRRAYAAGFDSDEDEAAAPARYHVSVRSAKVSEQKEQGREDAGNTCRLPCLQQGIKGNCREELVGGGLGQGLPPADRWNIIWRQSHGANDPHGCLFVGLPAEITPLNPPPPPESAACSPYYLV